MVGDEIEAPAFPFWMDAATLHPVASKGQQVLNARTLYLQQNILGVVIRSAIRSATADTITGAIASAPTAAREIKPAIVLAPVESIVNKRAPKPLRQVLGPVALK